MSCAVRNSSLNRLRRKVTEQLLNCQTGCNPAAHRIALLRIQTGLIGQGVGCQKQRCDKTEKVEVFRTFEPLAVPTEHSDWALRLGPTSVKLAFKFGKPFAQPAFIDARLRLVEFRLFGPDCVMGGWKSAGLALAGSASGRRHDLPEPKGQPAA